MFRLFCLIWFKLSGWTLDPHRPEGMNRCVMIAAPHTSNWDLVFSVAAFIKMKVPFKFTIKKEWMRFPYNLIMIPMGGIGIDRSPRKPGEERLSMVEAMADLFTQHQELAIMVTPEGTRGLRTEWKTGFYHVARLANVPIGLGYLNYAKKEAGVGKCIMPSGDMEKDLREIMDFYAKIGPKNPKNFSLDQRYTG